MVPVPEHAGVEITVPDDFESTTAKLIWLWLATNGAGTSKQVSRAIDEPQSKVLSILGVMTKRGTVERENGGKRAIFDVSNN